MEAGLARCGPDGESRIWDLKDDLYRSRQEPGEKISHYIERLHILWSQLQEAGDSTVTEKDVVRALLKGMDDSYKEYRYIVKSAGTLPTLSVATARLREFEKDVRQGSALGARQQQHDYGGAYGSAPQPPPRNQQPVVC